MPETPGRPATAPTRPSRAMGPGREAGMPSSGPRGAPFPRHGPARARRPDPAGTGRPGGIRRFARHGGVEPPSTVLETVGLPLSQWRVHVFRSSVFKSRRRPSVRWHATVCVPGRGDPLCGPRMHSGARVCIRMHQGMHTFPFSVSACFQRSGDGPEACMHCMHQSLIEDSGKGRKPLILMHTMHTR